MEYRDVKLRIELDVSDAAARADGLVTPQPGNPGGPSLPGQPAPDAGAGAGRGGAPVASGSPTTPAEPRGRDEDRDATGTRRPRGESLRDEEESEKRIEARVLARVGETARAARGGTLSNSVLGLVADAAGVIPGGAFAVRAGAMTAEHGPGIMAAVEQAAPTALRPVLRDAQRAVSGFGRAVSELRSYLDAGGAAIDYGADLAAGEARLSGRVNAEFLARATFARYSIEAQLMEAEHFRRQYGRERMGGAAGAVIQDIGARLAAGQVFSVGR